MYAYGNKIAGSMLGLPKPSFSYNGIPAVGHGLGGIPIRVSKVLSALLLPSIAEGVDFDGATDYLSRSTDLVGNVDSKTFTFSAWVYGIDFLTANRVLLTSGASVRFQVYTDGGGNITVDARNTAGTSVYSRSISVADKLPIYTFNHILVSVNLSSLTQSIYVNDSLVSGSATTITDAFVDFTNSQHTVAVNQNLNAGYMKGRLSNVFLDYTYRDLSIEANRRLFITADGKPADWNGLVALNPILALRMKDAATVHINEGIGGNFTPNGTFATSNRGANQDNCVASYFDGVADYLSRTSLTGIADGKQFVFSCELNTKNWNNTRVLTFANTGSNKLTITISTSGILEIRGFNSAGTLILSANSIDTITISKTVNISMSIDMTNTSSRVVKINNITIGMTWATYTNDTLMFLVNQYNISASATPSQYFNGNIGELYFDTVYMPLDVYNPFWVED